MRALPWWHERIVGAFMAYWIYQHLGNLAPPELAEERAVRRGAGRRGRRAAAARVRARLADRGRPPSRFAFHRDFGRSRLVVVDSRAARVLADGRRDMVDAEEWAWIVEHARGELRPPDHREHAAGVHAARHPPRGGVERGRLLRRLGRPRRARRRVAPPGARPRALAGVPALVRDHGRAAARARRGGEGGPPPATITLLGGDVHTAYVAEVAPAASAGSRVYQVVCSPFRNPLARA